ncbi:MAG: abortive infection system antitoxin AbiGi family protein [Sphingobacteriaceae bacterium]
MTKISQNVSSESLFHFIQKPEWLLEILENRSFQARYVYENTLEAEYKAGIAMKCFCDIPLGVIKKHMNRYGKFGIGIRKSFAKKNHITPVIYFHSNSDTYYRYISTITKKDVFGNKFSLFPYFKVESRTTLSLDEKKKTTERFYDEREWRYVAGDVIDCTNLTETNIKVRLDEANNILSSKRKDFLLPFEFSDITYIFVQFEKDVDKLIESIRKVDTSQIQQDRLIAKIVTSLQIERDF